MKYCSNPDCPEPLKPLIAFPVGDGWCRPCVNARQARYNAKQRAENPGRLHGLTPEQFWAMWDSQGAKCAICAKTLAVDGGRSVTPCIDHDHAHCCGDKGCPLCVRSILCTGCNYMLGRGHDDPATLRRWKPTKAYPQSRIDAAIAYLEYWHAEMAKRGIRPSPEETLWRDVYGALGRLVTEIS